MISENLYREVLLAPAETGASELRIVSGYASASMAHRHLSEDVVQQNRVSVKLIYGMAASDGVSLVDNAMFGQLQERGSFRCNYRIERPSIHSKVYLWMTGDVPTRAFVGSANYTQRGFLAPGQQQESMAETDPERALAFFEAALNGSMEIEHADIEHHVAFFSPRQKQPESEDCVSLSLLSNRGVVAARSGLNWGQRPGRNRNQAYLRVPSSVGQSRFFPSRAIQFTVLTDDGLSFIAVTAQDGDKAIETPDGNHILGEYFRRRLGVPLGDLVTRPHLDHYGRTDIEFCKLDDETFLLDFSVQP